jgi:SOS-response transcriptional repressor LexA
MLQDVLERVERRLEAVGLKAAEASKKAGLSPDAIRNMRRAVESPDQRKGVSTRTITALAPVLQTTTSWLLEGIGQEEAEGPPVVRIIGRVGADTEGTVFLADGQARPDFAPIPPGGSDKSVALDVTGHSMRGVADDGALIYFEDQRTPPSPDMVGHVVVLETEDGRVLVKRLLKGDSKGVYDLESLSGPTMPNVKIKWAAHITAIIPPFMARRIAKRSGEAA